MKAIEQFMNGNQDVSRQQFMTSDLACAGFLTLLLGLSLFIPAEVDNSGGITTRLAIALVLYLSVTYSLYSLLTGKSRAIIRIVQLSLLLGFLFDQMQYFQHVIFSSWLDGSILWMEETLVGTNITFALQQFINPIVTEGMMFCYVSYFPLLPLFAYVVYRSRGDQALSDYVITICLCFFACFIGYMIYPVASQLHFSPDLYTVPLKGGFFTWCGEWIRENQQYPGGTVPSAHTATATGMLVMLFRYNRRLCYVVLPTILVLYVSTVYCRYHYAFDAITGILCGLFVVRFSPLLVRWFGMIPNPSRSVSPSRKAKLEPRAPEIAESAAA